jgi:2-polyprenyl-3-methyl-5-hydroxy-6-metoxy-1,4-benzoquinol methylase
MAKAVKDPYQTHSPCFIQRVMWTLARLPTQGTFLDVGIGDGWLTSGIEEQGLTVTGIDANPDHAVYYEPRKMDAEALTFGDDSFDYVGAFESLEHMRNPAKAAIEMLRVATKKVFVTVPMKGRVVSPGHRHIFDGHVLRVLFPGCKVEEIPIGNPHKWYWVEVTP